jgi:hypothetical protein
VAWVHYFVLAFPAWVAVWSGSDQRSARPLHRGAIWVAAIATSGWLTLGQGPLRRAVHGANLYTWGGLLLLLLLAIPARDRPPETA